MTKTSPPGSVIVVGGISIDLVTYSSRWPAPGETILGKNFNLVLGGKGANQAVAASLAGMNTNMISCVGSDLFADFALESLESFGVDNQFVNRVDGPTGVAHIRVIDSGENNIVVVPLANEKISKVQIDNAFVKIQNPKVLLIQLEIPWEINKHAIQKARQAGCLIILDPAPAANLSPGDWALIDMVTPNESEAEAITGIQVRDDASAEAAGRWFLGQGVRIAVITMGSSGVLLVSNSEVKKFKAPKVIVVDTTAAGDAFAGFFGALLAEELTIHDAIEQAVVAASISVTRIGASVSIPSRKQVSGYFDLPKKALSET